MKNITAAVLGCGNLGQLICRHFDEVLQGTMRLVAVYDRNSEKARRTAEQFGIPAHFDRLEPLLADRPDYVIEAVSPAFCQSHAAVVLSAGSHLIPLSTGAFADDRFQEETAAAAQAAGSRILIPAGAIGGLDVMQAVALMGELDVTIVNRKPPSAYRGAPGLGAGELPEDRAVTLFLGTAREAIASFPQNLNVAVTTALMTAGVDRTWVEVISDPRMQRNSHEITIAGRFGAATVRVDSDPSRDNPKSSELAAWSVLALLKRQTSVIGF